MANCVVCGVSVEDVDVEAHEHRTFIDPVAIGKGVLRKTVVVICEKERCLRLLMEVLDDEGRREVKSG